MLVYNLQRGLQAMCKVKKITKKYKIIKLEQIIKLECYSKKTLHTNMDIRLGKSYCTKLSSEQWEKQKQNA